MRKKPRLLDSRRVEKSSLFQVEQLDLEFSNGETRTYERLHGRGDGVVIILPILNNDTLLLVREYACGFDRYELGLSKGVLESGEDLLEASNREMMEEIGYGAKKLTHISTMASSPGYSTTENYIVLAEDLYEERLEGDEPEELEVVHWPLDQLDDLLRQTDFTEARSIAAVLWFKHMRSQ